MKLLEKLFTKKEQPIHSYDDFWNWFQQHEKRFFKVVKNGNQIEKLFFDEISPKLAEIKDGYYFLAGMFDEETAELVLTPDGVLKNIVFVEELVNAAPEIEGWKFTALKPAVDIADVGIRMNGFDYSKDNLSFYANEYEAYPDEIDITIVYDDYREESKKSIETGVFIFLDNYLGELDYAMSIDYTSVVSRKEAKKALIPIEKLENYLKWRQKEFVEKYEGIRYNTDDDGYTAYQAETEGGKPLVAVINGDLLKWDSKASHPWIFTVEMTYDGDGQNGMPDEPTMDLLNEIENKILKELKDFEGHLNLGRETGNCSREIHFACKDFRKPSKVLYRIQTDNIDRVEMNFDVYKDKYWRAFERFM